MSGYEGWFCTELETECPDCGEVIGQPAGQLSEFLRLLDEHERCCPEAVDSVSEHRPDF